MQRVHSCYCHLNLERRDLRAATQRSACLQSNSACCQNRAPPEFRGAKPHGNSAKIILFFQISTLRQEIASGRCRFSGNRAGTDTAIPAAAVGEPQRSPGGRAAAGTLPYRRDRRGHQNDYREECCNRILPYRIQPSKITATSPGRGAATRHAPSAGGCGRGTGQSRPQTFPCGEGYAAPLFPGGRTPRKRRILPGRRSP